KPGYTVRLDVGAAFPESVQLGSTLMIDGQGKVSNPGLSSASWAAGAVLDGSALANSALALGKGGLVPMIDCIFQGVEVQGCGLKATGADLTSGIRAGAAGIFSLTDCFVHDCEDGVGAGGYATGWTLTNCLLVNCGLGDGGTHNVYVSTGTVRAIFTNCTSIVP